MTNPRDRGILPPVQDIVATAALSLAYFMRIASAADSQVPTPDVLVLTTDFLVPVLAAAWLWVAAIFVLVEQYSD